MLKTNQPNSIPLNLKLNTKVAPKIVHKGSSALAREEDGTLQITLRIPYEIIKKAGDEVLAELAKEIEIQGFRKGKAPIEKVRDRIGKNTLIEKALSKILPKALGDAISKFKIKPLIYPKFELIAAKEGEDWQIRAVTCEMPQIKLGDYKKAVSDTLKTSSIWTPDKGREAPGPEGLGPGGKNPPAGTKEEKEQEIIKILLSTSEVNVPKPLLDEEVDTRLAGLLERTEKLGLTLEKYLTSIGKTPETLRFEYKSQAQEALKLDLILIKIADEQNINISETEIDDAIKVSSNDKGVSSNDKKVPYLNTPDARRLVSSILRKRRALDSLSSLV